MGKIMVQEKPGPVEPRVQETICFPYFGRSVKPIPTRGADYAHYITTALPLVFLDLPPAL